MTSAVGEATTVVVEPRLPSRVRRPGDAVRLLLAVLLLVLVVGLGAAAVGTAGALEADLSLAASGLPRILLSVVGFVGGVGVIVLVLVVVADMLYRGRPESVIVGFASAGAGALIASGLEWLVQHGHLSDEVSFVLTRPVADGGRTPPLSEVIVATVALLTASSLNRRIVWPLGAAVVLSSMLTDFLGGTATAMAMVCSVLLGWVVGLVPRVALGIPSGRPAGSRIATALAEGGLRLARLEYLGRDQFGRLYRGLQPGGPPLDVEVFDVDAFSSVAVRQLLRSLHLRGPSVRRPDLTVRTACEHRTLMSLALERAGARAPVARVTRSAGAGTAVVAWERPAGTPIGQCPTPLDATRLTALFELAHSLRSAGIAHRSLTPSTVLVTDTGVALADVGPGDVAAADLALRLDLAHLLVIASLATSPPEAVDAAVRVLGPQAVIEALPVLQPVGLDPETRAALRGHREVLGTLQEVVASLAPPQDLPAAVELRRVTPRSLVMVGGGAVAAYVILGQLTGADLGAVIRNADWRWGALLPLPVALTFAGASLVLSGAILAPLRFGRTYLAQLAVAFSGLVAPAMVGNIAVNTRYLNKSGIPPAVAAGGIGLGQVAQFSSYITLFVLSAVAAGVGPQSSFAPPPGAVVGFVVVVLLVVALVSIPAVRRLASRRLLGHLRGVLPHLLGVLQRPRKMAQLIGGALLLDASFVLALFFATRAFGATTPLAAVAVTYFAGAVIGSAVPTPGGLGGVEAALAAGLVAVGTASGVAVSAVLLYRLATYWAPIPAGWVSLGHLQRVGAL